MRLFGRIISLPPKLANAVGYASLVLTGTAALWFAGARRAGNPMRVVMDEHGIERPMTSDELLAEEVRNGEIRI